MHLLLRPSPHCRCTLALRQRRDPTAKRQSCTTGACVYCVLVNGYKHMCACVYVCAMPMVACAETKYLFG